MYLAEEQFGTGVVLEPRRPAQLLYEQAISGDDFAIDMAEEYDVEFEFGGKLPTKDQGQSLSCTGQSASQYAQVLQIAELTKITGLNLNELKEHQSEAIAELSAKSIYSQVHLSNGGAYASHALGVLTKWGIATENQVPSQPNDEMNLRDKSWKNEIVSYMAAKMKNKAIAYIYPTSLNILAHAIKRNHGITLIVAGSNNGTWRTLFPEPPKEGEKLWYHMIYCGAYGKDERGEYIATPNSWGNLGGWQKLYADYLPFMQMANTLIDWPSQTYVRMYKKSVAYDKNLYRDLPMNEVVQISGFIKSGWSFYKLPNAEI